MNNTRKVPQDGCKGDQGQVTRDFFVVAQHPHNVILTCNSCVSIYFVIGEFKSESLRPLRENYEKIMEASHENFFLIWLI